MQGAKRNGRAQQIERNVQYKQAQRGRAASQKLRADELRDVQLDRDAFSRKVDAATGEFVARPSIEAGQVALRRSAQVIINAIWRARRRLSLHMLSRRTGKRRTLTFGELRLLMPARVVLATADPASDGRVWAVAALVPFFKAIETTLCLAIWVSCGVTLRALLRRATSTTSSPACAETTAAFAPSSPSAR